jgi:methylamine dehydrogenase heavy chain
MMRSFALAAGLAAAVSTLSILGGAPALAAPSAASAAFPKPLPEETLPSVAKLPTPWPASWVLIHDFRFQSIVDGRVAVVDTTDPVRPLKGLVRAAQFANMLVSRERGKSTLPKHSTAACRAGNAPMRSPSGTWRRWSPRARSCCPVASASNR